MDPNLLQGHRVLVAIPPMKFHFPVVPSKKLDFIPLNSRLHITVCSGPPSRHLDCVPLMRLPLYPGNLHSCVDTDMAVVSRISTMYEQLL